MNKIMALLFLMPLASWSQTAQPAVTIETLKSQIKELLIKGQKNEAMEQIKKVRISNPGLNQQEVTKLMMRVSQSFASREAQEAYENSLNASAENPKESIKQVEICLQKEPEQLDCLIQKLKWAYRNKSEKDIETSLKEVGDLTRGTKVELWTELMSKKAHLSPHYKNKMVTRKIQEEPTEEHFVLLLLELERSLTSKNYSRAREIVNYFTKNFPDYPDTSYFSDRINDESRESTLSTTNDLGQDYKARCKNQSLSLQRKYRYDFDLCRRGL